MSRGQNLQRNAPTVDNPDLAVATAWVESVTAWINETHQFLAHYSSQAASSFLHEGVRASLIYHGISAQARQLYPVLLSRLDNLRGIMEKPDVYF